MNFPPVAVRTLHSEKTQGQQEVGWWKLTKYSNLLFCSRIFYTSKRDLWKLKQAKQKKKTDNHLPIIMGCGSLFTPTPALVLAATSTRYWIPGYRPPITTDRIAASTVLLTWNRVSLPRHQIWDKSWCVKNNTILHVHKQLYIGKTYLYMTI